MIVSIDFETRSLIDLPKAGAHRYAQDPSTQILCMSWAVDYDEPELWVPGQRFPKDLDELFNAFDTDYPVQLNAWNSQFEELIWKHVGYERMGWPYCPVSIWHDTMGDAAMCSYPLKLSFCAKALELDELKDSSGTALINLLSKPKADGTFREYKDHPDLFKQLYDYCKQDVRTERAVYHTLPDHVSGIEDEIQRDTWHTNNLGVPIDRGEVQMINDHLENKIAQLDNDIEAHTGGIVTSATQRNRVLCNLEMNREAADTHIANREFLKSNGVTVPRFSVKEIPGITLDNLQGDNIEQVLATWALSEYDRYLLENYMAKNHASVAKFKKMLLQVCDDGTIKGNLQYHGAGTGRDAARGVQLQNLPRATAKDPEQLLKWFALHDTATLDMIFEILETASTLIRPSLQAPVGSKFVVSDYGQVEARGAAWTAKEEKILQNFRDGVPVYEAQAADMYDVDIDSVEPLQRQYGKLAVLACGYQGSHKALTKFAENYGLTIERKEAGKVVRAFRTSRPLLVDSWSNFGAAAVAATNAPGKRIQVPKCQHAVFQMQGKHLTLELPSGRKIWYPEADVRVVTVRYEDEETGETRTFQAESVTCKKLVGARWLRGGISGGNFFQNYVQAICRDMIMVAALRAGKAGYPVVGRIHDELITLVPDDSRYSIAELNKIMEVLPEWATNFPIKAAGYESKRYKK